MLGADYTKTGESAPLGIYSKRDIRCYNPAAIAINPRNGEIALADAAGHQYLIFSPGQGGKIQHTCQQGSYSEPSSRFRKPSGVAYSREGHLAVADEEACTIQIFADLGRVFTCVFGKPGAELGELVQPGAVDWIMMEAVAVLDAGNSRVQIFTTEGQSLGCVGGSLTLTSPVDLAFYSAFPLRGEELYPVWLHRHMTRDEMVAAVSRPEHRHFLVRQQGSSKEITFEMLVKNTVGPVDLKAAQQASAMTSWLDSYIIEFHAGTFYTPPLLIIQPAAPQEELAAESKESEGEEEQGQQKGGGAVEEEEATQSGSETSDETQDTESKGGEEEAGQGAKQAEAADEEPVAEEKVYSFATLAETVRFLADYAGCRWPEDGRRRAQIAVLDRTKGLVQMYGYVAAQGVALGMGELALSPPALFTMNRFGRFKKPSGLCFDTFGNVIVADSGHDRIAIHRASTGLLVHVFRTEPHVRDLPLEAFEDDDAEAADAGQQPQQKEPVEGSSEAPPAAASSPARGAPSSSSTPSSSPFRRRRSSVGSGPPLPPPRKKPTTPPKTCAPLLVTYNHCKRGLGSQGEGSFVVLMNRELYIFQAARRVPAGLWSELETEMFYNVCDFLSYDEARPLACTSRFLREAMRVMRRDWRLWPLMPRSLVGTKKLFIDWCRTDYGDKIRVDSPPQDPKAPIPPGRKLICQHWVKDGKCAVFKLHGCPTKFYLVLDHEVEGQQPCVEFEHGLFAAVCQVFGYRYWFENEHILRRIFDSLAVDKSLTFHTGRRTGEVRLIKHHQETAKVLDYRGFLEFMLRLQEDRLGLRLWRELPCLHGVDLVTLKKGMALDVFEKHSAMVNEQTHRVVAIMNAIFT